MTSYRETLLTQAEPLEPHEVRTLEEWLEVLAQDVALFGATPEDEARIGTIERRIADAGGPSTGPGR